MSDRRLVIAVCGSGEGSDALDALAEQVGRDLARAGAALICGGLGGVMAAAARGAQQVGGLTLGVLPGARPEGANPWIAVALPTGMGEARNVLLVRFASAVIAIGGEWGTLSEVALATRMGIPVVLLSPGPLLAQLGLEIAHTPEAAVRAALQLAEQSRGR